MWAYLIRVAGGLVVASAAVGAQPPSPATKAAAAVRPGVTQGIASAKVERAANRTTLAIATKMDAPPGLKLFDAAGTEVPSSRTADGMLRAEIDPKKGYLLAPASSPVRPLTREGLHFPGRYVNFTDAGGTRLGGLFLQPAAIPLTWKDAARAYTTELVVGYDFDDGAERDLTSPKTVQFFVEGANARVEANTVRVTKSGPSGYQNVVLFTGQLDGETRITAHAGPIDQLKTTVAVQREPATLQLSVPPELPAFGIGSGTLAVTLLARDGMPLAAPQNLEVQLSSRRLHHPATARIEAGNSSVNVDVRSTGFGRTEIVAQTGAWRATAPLDLIFPVAATIAALLGGSLGGVARYLRNKRRGRSLLLRRMGEGAVVALILVGAAWTGLVTAAMSTGIFGTPFGAFVIGALSGYLGCVVLDRVANKTFPTAKAAE